MKRFVYTDEHFKFIKENAVGISNEELAKRFNKRFGLNKTGHQLQNVKCKVGVKSGVNSGRFKKGQISWNKGKKMTSEQYEKCKDTMFKKGNKPSNWRPLGSERVDKRDNGILIKVRDGALQKNWMSKGIYIYEQAYGKIPEGHYVIYADGNNRNFDLDNLVLVSNAEELIMNKKGLFKRDKELTKAGANIAKLLDKTNKLKKVK